MREVVTRKRGSPGFCALLRPGARSGSGPAAPRLEAEFGHGARRLGDLQERAHAGQRA
jgi:hypothetical protein